MSTFGNCERSHLNKVLLNQENYRTDLNRASSYYTYFFFVGIENGRKISDVLQKGHNYRACQRRAN